MKNGKGLLVITSLVLGFALISSCTKKDSSSMPTVTTTAASAITATSATAGGNVTSDGGASVTARGVVWGTTAAPTTTGSKTTNGTGKGTFNSSLMSLTPDTKYYVRAYGTNSVGTAYGNEVSFTTTSNMGGATVTTDSITAITDSTAVSGGNITADGGSAITGRGIVWGTSTNPTMADSTTSDGTGTGLFVSNLTGLTATTTYYVKAYAINSSDTTYGNERTFQTP